MTTAADDEGRIAAFIYKLKKLTRTVVVEADRCLDVEDGRNSVVGRRYL